MSDFFGSFDTKRKKHDVISKISSIPSNYVGSKRRLLPHIWDFLDKKNVEFESAFDAFAQVNTNEAALAAGIGQAVFNEGVKAGARSALKILVSCGIE